MKLIDNSTKAQLIDFLIGFFALPFMFFTVKVTVLLVYSSKSITEGMGIIYIALMTGWYYVLSGKSIIHFSEKPHSSRAKDFGFISFILAWLTMLLVNILNIPQKFWEL